MFKIVVELNRGPSRSDRSRPLGYESIGNRGYRDNFLLIFDTNTYHSYHWFYFKAKISFIHPFEVFRYSFSETIPMFFNRLKSDFILVRSPQNFHFDVSIINVFHSKYAIKVILKSSSETQGQIVGTRESLHGWENVARRKVKNGEKSPWGQCLTRPVPNGRRCSGF